MSKRSLGIRSVSVVVAVLLAALAVLALLSYIRGVRDEAEAQNEPVQAFVATAVIPAGTTAEEAVSRSLIGRENVPSKLVASQAVGSLQQLAGKVATVDILPGEQIVTARWAAPGDVRGIDIPKDRQAMSVQVAVPPGVAGYVQTDDRVSIIASVDLPPSTPGGAAPADGNSQAQDEPHVQYLLQGIQVLAVGPHTANDTGDASTTSDNVLLTLAVDPQQAEKLAYATLHGQLYFTLLPRDQEAPVTTPGRTRLDLFK